MCMTAGAPGSPDSNSLSNGNLHPSYGTTMPNFCTCCRFIYLSHMNSPLRDGRGSASSMVLLYH
jgi:hypothetical protein